MSRKNQQKGKNWVPIVGVSVVITILVIVGIYVLFYPKNKRPEIPTVINMEKSEAERFLTKKGFLFEISDTFIIDTLKDKVGRVVTQTPKAGESVSKDNKVTIKIGKKGRENPSLIGKSIKDIYVHELLTDKHYNIEKKYVNSDSEAYIIIGQFPEPAGIIPFESTITLTVGFTYKNLSDSLDKTIKDIEQKQNKNLSLGEKLQDFFSDYLLYVILGVIVIGLIVLMVYLIKKFLRRQPADESPQIQNQSKIPQSDISIHKTPFGEPYKFSETPNDLSDSKSDKILAKFGLTYLNTTVNNISMELKAMRTETNKRFDEFSGKFDVLLNYLNLPVRKDTTEEKIAEETTLPVNHKDAYNQSLINEQLQEVYKNKFKLTRVSFEKSSEFEKGKFASIDFKPKFLKKDNGRYFLIEDNNKIWLYPIFNATSDDIRFIRSFNIQGDGDKIKSVKPARVEKINFDLWQLVENGEVILG